MFLLFQHWTVNGNFLFPGDFSDLDQSVWVFTVYTSPVLGTAVPDSHQVRTDVSRRSWPVQAFTLYKCWGESKLLIRTFVNKKTIWETVAFVVCPIWLVLEESRIKQIMTITSKTKGQSIAFCFSQGQNRLHKHIQRVCVVCTTMHMFSEQILQDCPSIVSTSEKYWLTDVTLNHKPYRANEGLQITGFIIKTKFIM